MANNTCTEVQETHAPVWRGFGHWNFYFMAKLGLYWAGSINFDIFYNAVFAAFLLLPLRPNTLSVLRHWLAVPIAIAVLYYDSWLPPIQRLIEQPEVLNFSSDYLLELLLRFINWQLLGTGFIFLVVYLFLASWLRMTAWSLLALLLVALPRMPGLPHFSFNDATDVVTQGLNIAPNNTAAAPRAADMNTVLNEELERFYQAEQSRRTEFSAPTADAAPFDVLLLNVCSLAWSDLEISQLSAHPLFEKMDIMFDQFNSATSYSGPAVIRLMRASCGQTGHKALYQSADSQCHIFENLRALGFTDSAALNHTGEFENFIDELKVAGLSAPPLVPRRLRPHLKGFDGTPIWSDYDALNMWWQERLASDAPATALFYNSITLHDGNREATLDGGSRVSPYPKRAKQLLDDFDSFMQEIEASGRQAMVVFVPEHGAALAGDRMQMSGMREIPAPAITHVPVGVRFIGTQAEPPKKTIHIDTASSYLALSELVSRAVSRAVFDAPQVDWLARGLRAEAAQLYRRESPSFTLHNDSWWRRDGTPGISELNANTTMAHLEFPLTQGRAFLRTDHVRMDAGTFKKDATGAYSERFASCNFAGLDSQGDTQSLVGCGRGFTQKADGTSFAAGWTDEQWSFDLGSTPYGFTVQNWVGGISYADKIGVTGFTLTASRRPLSSSLLSFSGRKIHAQVLNGVV